MIAEDRARFVRGLMLLGGVFGRQVDEATIEGFWLALADLTVDEIEEAAAEVIRTGQHFPRPAELRELASATSAVAGLRAWDQVLALARNSREAEHPDPVAEQCVRQLGGWVALGQQPTGQLTTWTRKSFLDLYEAAADRARVTRRLDGCDAPLLAPVARKALAG
jgi:hypothetical protein